MEKSRVNRGKAAPQPIKPSPASTSSKDLTNSAGFAEGFVHLLRLRAPQINQCAYCVRSYTRDALKAGESFSAKWFHVSGMRASVRRASPVSFGVPIL